MAFFEDLSPYCYLHPDEESPDTVNIGWLDNAHPFPVGSTDAAFRRRLKTLAHQPVKQTRGVHFCPFCLAVQRGNSADS
jgi:hypothetical protein